MSKWGITNPKYTQPQSQVWFTRAETALGVQSRRSSGLLLPPQPTLCSGLLLLPWQNIMWTWWSLHAYISGFLLPARCAQLDLLLSVHGSSWVTLSDAVCLSFHGSLQLCLSKMDLPGGSFQHGNCPWGDLGTVQILTAVDIPNWPSM